MVIVAIVVVVLQILAGDSGCGHGFHDMLQQSAVAKTLQS